MSSSTPASKPFAPAGRKDEAMLPVKNRPLLLLGVILISLCQFLDTTIANVALPFMRSSLGASAEAISWVLTSFMMATAIGTPICGWLSDYFGSRNLYLWSVITFLLASAACGASTSLSALVAFRMIQGLAAAFIGPMTMTIMFDISKPSQQAASMSIYSMIVMMAPVCGPTLGGYLTEYLNWRWIFYVNLPLGIPALFLVWWLLPSRQITKRRLDMFGYGVLAICLAAMQLMFDRGQEKDWFTSKEIVIELIVMLSAIWIFIVHSRGHSSPLFNAKLFKNRNFLIGLGFMSIMGITLLGVSAILPMLYQSIYGYPIIYTGLLMAPRGIGGMLTMSFSGNLARKYDPRWIIFVGYLINALGMWMMTQWSIDMDYTPIILAGLVQGIGFGLIMPPLQYAAFNSLTQDLRPEGSSLLSLGRSIGGSLGISIIVALLSRYQQVSHSDIASSMHGTFIDTVSRIGNAQAPAIMVAINGEVTRQAVMIAYLDNFYILMWMMLLVAPLTLLFRKSKAAAASDSVMHISE